jgi:hypothetical protein
MLVACLALFIAMGGAGYAAFKLKPNSVKTKNIKNGAVKEKKIADGAVTNKKIADGAVTGAKIANGAIGSSKFFLSGTSPISFGSIAGETCSSINIPAAGVTTTDHVVITPPTGWPDTFSVTGSADTNVVHAAACNTFTGGGSVDPDGGGGVRFLVIR